MYFFHMIHIWEITWQITAWMFGSRTYDVGEVMIYLSHDGYVRQASGKYTASCFRFTIDNMTYECQPEDEWPSHMISVIAFYVTPLYLFHRRLVLTFRFKQWLVSLIKNKHDDILKSSIYCHIICNLQVWDLQLSLPVANCIVVVNDIESTTVNELQQRLEYSCNTILLFVKIFLIANT